jgi:hypothetical protein
MRYAFSLMFFFPYLLTSTWLLQPWSGNWKYHFLRPDKVKANFIRIFHETMESIAESIPASEIIQRLSLTPETDRFEQHLRARAVSLGSRTKAASMHGRATHSHHQSQHQHQHQAYGQHQHQQHNLGPARQQHVANGDEHADDMPGFRQEPLADD